MFLCRRKVDLCRGKVDLCGGKVDLCRGKKMCRGRCGPPYKMLTAHCSFLLSSQARMTFC